MDVRYLRDFISVAKNASFTKAARQLNISQPALSKRIAAVEEEAGCQLLDRNVNPIVLTPHGRVFLENAQQVVVEYDAMLQRMKDLAHSKTGLVSVVSHMGVRPTDDLIRRTCARLSKSDPLLDIRRYNAEISSPLSDLNERIADVAVVSGAGAHIPGTRSYPLFEEPLCAVVRRDHRLAEASMLSPADLSGDVIWNSLSAPVARHYLAIKDLLEEAGADATFHELTFHGSPDELSLEFEKGIYVDGASVIVHSLPLIALEDDYIAIPIEGDMRLINRMLVREDDETPSTMAFVNTMTNIAEEADMSLYWQRPHWS